MQIDLKVRWWSLEQPGDKKVRNKIKSWEGKKTWKLKIKLEEKKRKVGNKKKLQLKEKIGSKTKNK